MASPAATLWLRRFLVALLLSSLVLVSGLAAGWWYLNAKWRNATDVELNLSMGPESNYLVLGSDSREFVEGEEDLESFGTVGGRRADTLILVRINPKEGKALLVSFPRDLWVEIPGKGSNRINSAFADGPQAVIDTFRHNFDIPIHHYLQVDFGGFRKIVDAMGGVTMYVPAPARDFKTGLDVREAGCVTLDGEQGLAWVRSRQYQSYESGTWRSDPTGDFGRIQRQQDFIRRLIGQALASGTSNPFRGDDLIDTGLENITVDSDFGVRDALRLAKVFRSGDPEDVEMLTIPAVVGRRGAASVVLATSEAEAVYERLRQDAFEEGDATPSQTSIRVLNGVGTAGLATRTAADLRAVGFLPGGLGDAGRFGYRETEIRHRSGSEAKAELVQRFLGGVGTLVADDSVSDVDVLLVLGADFTGVLDEPEEALRTPAFALTPIASVTHGGGDEGDDGGEDPTPAGSEDAPAC